MIYMYGCSQPRELWFIDFNHVHVHVHVCICIVLHCIPVRVIVESDKVCLAIIHMLPSF